MKTKLKKLLFTLLVSFIVIPVQSQAFDTTTLKSIQEMQEKLRKYVDSQVAEIMATFIVLKDSIADIPVRTVKFQNPVEEYNQHIDLGKFIMKYSYNRCQIIMPNGDYILYNGNFELYIISKTYIDGSAFHNIEVSKNGAINLYNNYAEDIRSNCVVQSVKCPYEYADTWIDFPNGTYGFVTTHDNDGNYKVANAHGLWDAVKKLWFSDTMPNLELNEDSYTEIKIYKGKELVNTIVPKRQQTYIASVEAEQKAAKKADEQAYQELCKRFGKTYTDAALKGHLIIGSPEKLFLATVDRNVKVSYAKLWKQTANATTYELYGPRRYDTSNTTTIKNGFVGWAYFQNGKLKSVQWTN